MPATATKPSVSEETLQAARNTVRALLESSEAYARMPEANRKALAHDLVQVGSFLAEPGMRVPAQHMSPDVLSLAQADAGSTKVGDQPKFGQAVRTGVEQAVALIEGVHFPAFVSGLIEGVFHSIVKSSIEQMEAYGKLVADVSKSLNQFRDDNTTANQGRDHLVEQFPDLFELQMPGDDDPFGSFGDAAPAGPRVSLREGVDERLRDAQRLADVADRAAGAVRRHDGGDRGAVAAVLAVDVLDHLLAPLVLEVDVDVRRLLALLADETLEQQVGAGRIHFGDVQAVADRGVGGRAPALAQDLALARMAHDVVHRQEVHLVAAVGDQPQFMHQLAPHRPRDAAGVAALRPFDGEAAQRLGRGHSRRHRLRRVLVLDLLQAERAAAGDHQRVLEQINRIERRQPGARRNGAQTNPAAL